MKPSRILAGLFLVLQVSTALAHHVLGRPAYSLNEDSNTPPSMQVETQIGNYFITYMVFPAFPRPGDPGRINLYVKRLDNDQPLQTTVTFKVRDDSWFSSHEEVIGTQEAVDNVYRQGFVFNKPGKYIVTAEFTADGEPYIIDFPLQIGEVSSVGPIGLAVGALVIILVGVNLLQRKRLARLKTRDYHADRNA